MVARTNSSDVGSTTKIIKLYIPHCSSMLNEPFLEKREKKQTETKDKMTTESGLKLSVDKWLLLRVPQQSIIRK